MKIYRNKDSSLESRAKSLFKNSQIREGGKLKWQLGNNLTLKIVLPERQRPGVPRLNITLGIYFSIIQSCELYRKSEVLFIFPVPFYSPEIIFS